MDYAEREAKVALGVLEGLLEGSTMELYLLEKCPDEELRDFLAGFDGVLVEIVTPSPVSGRKVKLIFPSSLDDWELSVEAVVEDILAEAARSIEYIEKFHALEEEGEE